MPEDHLNDHLYESDGTIATITMNRPERGNCMTRDSMNELERLIFRVRDERETRVLILTGAGRMFCAGADVSAAKGVTDATERVRIFSQRNKGGARMNGRVFDLITRLDCMTIAAVNGYAVGGGWVLALACDFVVATENAEFWVPEVELGAAFTGAPAEVMARRMGPWRAKEACINCRRYSANELLAMGMANRVVGGADELIPAARKLAAELIAKPRKASTRTKHAIDSVFVGPRHY